MTSDPVIKPLANELLDCLAAEVAKVTDPPELVCLRPGSVVNFLLSTLDDECCRGLAWVRLDTFYPSSRVFPEQDATPLKEGIPARAWTITLEMGVARCAPVPDADNMTPCSEWHALSEKIMDDAAAMRRAVCCFIDAEARRRGKVLVGTYAPVDVQGGCVGGILPVTIQGPACDCPDES